MNHEIGSESVHCYAGEAEGERCHVWVPPTTHLPPTLTPIHPLTQPEVRWPCVHNEIPAAPVTRAASQESRRSLTSMRLNNSVTRWNFTQELRRGEFLE